MTHTTQRRLRAHVSTIRVNGLAWDFIEACIRSVLLYREQVEPDHIEPLDAQNGEVLVDIYFRGQRHRMIFQTPVAGQTPTDSV